MISKTCFHFFSLSILLLILICITLSAGCTGTEKNAPDIADEYKSNVASVDDYSLSVVQDLPGGLHYIEVLYKCPDQYILRHYYEPENKTWTQSIHNLTYINYIPESKTADVLVISDPKRCFPPIYDPNRLALSVLFSGDFILEYLNIEPVNGRDAYVIEAVNEGYTDYFGEGSEGEIKIWIDREEWITTKISAYDKAGNLKADFEVKNFSINTGISDNEFLTDLPEKTKIRHPNPFCS